MLAPIVKNVSGEVIPAFALMRVVNTTHNGDRLVLEVGKPNGECGAAYVVNGKINIQIDGHGSYQDASNHFVLLTDETTGMVGPIPNSWTAGIGKMYNVLGPAKDTAARASLVAIDRLSLEKFRIDEDLQSCGVAPATLLADDCAVIKSIYVRDTTGQAYTDELMASGAMGFCRFTSEVMLDPITIATTARAMTVMIAMTTAKWIALQSPALTSTRWKKSTFKRATLF